MFEFFKSLHIIGFVSWFAALFYMPRLFIYHVEAMDKPAPISEALCEQFHMMQKRLYSIIMTPAMVITFIGGFSMIYLRGMAWLEFNVWIYWKLLLIAGLVVYHFYSKGLIRRLGAGERVMTSTQLRLYNEVTTLFLVAIVLLAVYKNSLHFFSAFAGLFGLGIFLGLGVRAYKKIRLRADES